ncbi:MAG: hypothetical protein WA184_22180, partial [Stellaceae bacterium]
DTRCTDPGRPIDSADRAAAGRRTTAFRGQVTRPHGTGPPDSRNFLGPHSGCGIVLARIGNGGIAAPTGDANRRDNGVPSGARCGASRRARNRPGRDNAGVVVSRRTAGHGGAERAAGLGDTAAAGLYFSPCPAARRLAGWAVVRRRHFAIAAGRAVANRDRGG